MSKIVVMVRGGVAEWNNDPEVEVLYLDLDDLALGEDDQLTSGDIEGFEHLIPNWIIKKYVTE
jgi:hypothetical protein